MNYLKNKLYTIFYVITIYVISKVNDNDARYFYYLISAAIKICYLSYQHFNAVCDYEPIDNIKNKFYFISYIINFTLSLFMILENHQLELLALLIHLGFDYYLHSLIFLDFFPSKVYRIKVNI